MRVPEEHELGAHGLGRENDPAQTLDDSFEVAVEKEDGTIGAADEAPGPERGIVIAVAPHAFDAGQPYAGSARSGVEVVDSVAQMRDEIHFSGKCLQRERKGRDVMMRVRDREDVHGFEYSPGDGWTGTRYTRG